MGAWIEIVVYLYCIDNLSSLPLWERGLKSLVKRRMKQCGRVAPLVGAWIEIKDLQNKKTLTVVAPLVGAWIEIMSILKCLNICVVAPLVGAWIEIAAYPDKSFCPDRRSPCGSVD